MRGLVVLTLITLGLLGCASAYKGPEPNFALTGAAAYSEAEKFRLNEGHHFVDRGSWFEMGPEKSGYTISSLRPMIEKISPEAGVTLSRARKWNFARYTAFTLATAAGVMAYTNDHKQTSNKLTAVALIAGAGGVASGFVYDSLLSSAAYQFNRDLKTKFTPMLVWNFTY